MLTCKLFNLCHFLKTTIEMFWRISDWTNIKDTNFVFWYCLFLKISLKCLLNVDQVLTSWIVSSFLYRIESKSVSSSFSMKSCKRKNDLSKIEIEIQISTLYESSKNRFWILKPSLQKLFKVKNFEITLSFISYLLMKLIWPGNF